MIKQLILKDIRKNKTINAALCIFILITAILMSGAFGIISEVLTSMDNFNSKAQSLDYMQMLKTKPSIKQIDNFSSNNSMVKKHQVIEMLGIDNSNLYFNNDEPDTDSVMENSFVTQSDGFDYLLDLDNHVFQAKAGEIGVPVYAMETYDLKVGDTILVKTPSYEKKFKIKSFIRDSQMNPSMVSSKRFVVNERDYKELKENVGETEYLAEFLLNDSSKVSDFEKAYIKAGLPNELAITNTIIKLMNALSTGLVAVLLLLSSLILMGIALLCLRFIMMTTLEEDIREIGIMKAVGLSQKSIKKLYRSKYYAMGAISCTVGLVLSFGFNNVMTQNVKLYMGEGESSVIQFVLPVIGALLAFLIICGFTNLLLRKLKKISIIDSIRGEDTQSGKTRRFFRLNNRKKMSTDVFMGIREVLSKPQSYAILIAIFLLSTFLIIVPMNLLTTMESPEFVAYSGTGSSDGLVTLKNSDDVESRYEEMIRNLDNDATVKNSQGYVTARYEAYDSEGEKKSINIESGNHEDFSAVYLQGRAPNNSKEIALSGLNAEEYQKNVGDTMTVVVENNSVKLKVVGIYQDITNSGRTAKAMIPHQQKNAIWYTAKINFVSDDNMDAQLDRVGEEFYPAKVIGVQDYMGQTFSSTITQLKAVIAISSALALGISMLTIVLFLRMLMAKEKDRLLIMKRIGFSVGDLRLEYFTRVFISLISGLVLGIIASMTLGEMLVRSLMGTFGASQIDFVINPLMVYLIFPIVLMACAVIATQGVTKRIKHIEILN